MSSPPLDAKSKAACDYIESAVTGLNNLNTAVCKKSGAAPDSSSSKPAAKLASDITTLTLTDIESWLKAKATIKGNEFLEGATVAKDTDSTKPDEFTITAKDGKNFNIHENLGLDATADDIAAALGPEGTTKMAGGRRGKRSARRSKSRKGGRRSRKGGRKSRARKGNKGRRSRGRTIKGGAKMSKELKAWMKRQKKATGITAISKKTIDAAKTTSQATGSEQRSDSSKHVAAKQRNF